MLTEHYKILLKENQGLSEWLYLLFWEFQVEVNSPKADNIFFAVSTKILAVFIQVFDQLMLVFEQGGKQLGVKF